MNTDIVFTPNYMVFTLFYFYFFTKNFFFFLSTGCSYTHRTAAVFQYTPAQIQYAVVCNQIIHTLRVWFKTGFTHTDTKKFNWGILECFRYFVCFNHKLCPSNCTRSYFISI